MTHKAFVKNSSETVRVTPTRYQGYDLVDIRIFAKTKGGETVRTRKGVSLNVDQVPELLECLEWALQQACDENPESVAAPILDSNEADLLAIETHKVLAQYGLPVHWDFAEKMVLDNPRMKRFNKWHLHFVLATRRDLFAKEDAGCFRAL